MIGCHDIAPVVEQRVGQVPDDVRALLRGQRAQLPAPLSCIFSHEFNAGTLDLERGEHGPHVLARHYTPDGVVLHSAADDNAAAVLQRVAGRGHLGLHSASPVVGLLAKLDVVCVDRVKVGQQLRALLLRRLVVDSLDIGHEYGQVGTHVNGDGGGEAVVVPAYAGPIHVPTLVAHANGAVTPADEPAVVAARAEHLAARGAVYAAAAPVIAAGPAYAAAPLAAAAPL